MRFLDHVTGHRRCGAEPKKPFNRRTIAMKLNRSILRTAALGVSLLSFAALPGTAFAVEEQNTSHGATLAGPGLAAHGYDVVSYFGGQPVVGSDKFALAHNGATYRFANQAALDTFKADPAKYEPAFGGYCAYGAALNKKFDGDPRFWKIVGGRLYLNLNGDIQAKWSEDVAGNIKKAEGNWEKIKSVAVDKL
jgi:YHS domain-containing protein